MCSNFQPFYLRFVEYLFNERIKWLGIETKTAVQLLVCYHNTSVHLFASYYRYIHGNTYVQHTVFYKREGKAR